MKIRKMSNFQFSLSFHIIQAILKITLKLDNLQDSFNGFGNKELRLLDENDMVFRKSNFICDRTVLINCTKSSNEINREIIKKLKIPGKKLLIRFEIY